MVTCRLYGQMGNQMFQIAATIAYALKHKIDYYIPRTITCPPGTGKEAIYFPHLSKEAKSIPANNQFVVLQEPADQSYAELPAPDGRSIELFGHFQSEKYFSHYRTQIIRAFNIPWTSEYNFVSIHVRRGDYLDDQMKWPVVTVDYIREAIKIFKSKGRKNFAVFSDDIEWCRQHINSDNFKKCQFSYVTGTTALQDMTRMSHCHHHIIANSSFSWWGAWLNRNQSKIVVAPKKWTGHLLRHLNLKDLLPESWIKL